MALTKRALVLGATAVALSGMFVACVQINGTFSKAASFLSLPKSGLLQENPKELVDEVWQVVDSSYVDGTFNQTDWRAVRKDYLSRSYSSKPEAYGAIREMLKKLGDPYTRFMDPDEFRNMKIDTSGELTGVGIQLAADDKTKKLTVVAPIDGSPAANAGIRSKDIITKINDETTEGMDDKIAVTRIRGPIGTRVKLTVLRGTQTLDFDLKRDKIEIHPVRANVQKAANGSTIGYIRLVQFNANAPREMRDAIQNLEKQQVSGYVLDLRSNPGGLLNASVDIARMWLQKGAIVSTVDRQGESDRQAANHSALTEKPMVVIVDGGSASASEILSGALQDNKRGKIVGLKTFGKGLVQSVRDLGDNESGMAVTIAKYLTPNGRDIHKHGIDPDVEVKLTEPEREELIKDRDKIGTPADPQFAKALQVLQQEDVAKTS